MVSGAGEALPTAPIVTSKVDLVQFEESPAPYSQMSSHILEFDVDDSTRHEADELDGFDALGIR